MEPIDHMKALQKDARINLSSQYVELDGLAMARAHQRGEHVGYPRRGKRASRPETDAAKPAKTITLEVVAGVKAAKADGMKQYEIAAKFNISPKSVSHILSGHYD